MLNHEAHPRCGEHSPRRLSRVSAPVPISPPSRSEPRHPGYSLDKGQQVLDHESASRSLKDRRTLTNDGGNAPTSPSGVPSHSTREGSVGHIAPPHPQTGGVGPDQTLTRVTLTNHEFEILCGGPTSPPRDTQGEVRGKNDSKRICLVDIPGGFPPPVPRLASSGGLPRLWALSKKKKGGKQVLLQRPLSDAFPRGVALVAFPPVPRPQGPLGLRGS